MNKILIITNADMSLQSGNVILINRRAHELFKKFGISTTCIVLNKYCKKSINHGVEGIEYIVSDKKNLNKYVETYISEKIIFYGTMSYLYVNRVKKILRKLNYKAEILLDIQGALEEIIEYEKGFNLIKNYFKYFLKKEIMKKAINSVDGAFVVTDELGSYCKNFLKLKNKNKFKVYKVRCCINNVLSSEEKIEYRKEIRDYWNIDDDTIVMAFSGYRMSWQNIDKIMNLFKQFDKKIEKVFFAFFCNIDDEFELKVKESFPKGNYELKFLSFDEYFKYLCACDVGFLIRDYNITNEVAFPNKFSDYLNAGLILAMNKALKEPLRVIDEYNLKYIDTDSNIEDCSNIMANRHKNILDYYKTTEKICKNELLYSRQIEKLNIQANHKKVGGI
ncbi:hypothetical protein GCM10008904_19120 [Paraclostridium ghonii]|uniref:Glycosyltransferase n=1 Tax=Paraclostridium ghonii TaxID=29358 RepID=A0ABU0MW84_9FIRM|nr:hypothetical protein [Paeniclostridium ghonii]MDQ0555166.1 hypothetical protein [Paeniclostridium ghonii]